VIVRPSVKAGRRALRTKQQPIAKAAKTAKK